MKKLLRGLTAINNWYVDEFVHWAFHHFMVYVVFPLVVLVTPALLLVALYQALTK